MQEQHQKHAINPFDAHHLRRTVHENNHIEIFKFKQWLRLFIVATLVPLSGCSHIYLLSGGKKTAPDYERALRSDYIWGFKSIKANERSLALKNQATSSPISHGSYTPTAAFLGNQLAIVGAALDAPNALTGTLLVRENNCSLTQYAIGSETISTTLPNADAYLHNVSGMSSTAGGFPNNCDNRTLGIPSAPLAYLGQTSNGDVLTAISLYSGASGYTLTLGRINAVKPSINTTDLAKGVAKTLAAADFNGDSIADIVTPFISANNQSGIGVFLSNADGSFKPVTIYPTDASVFFARASIEDINADGKLDIVSLSAVDFSTSPKLSTLLGNGDGSFQAGPSLAASQTH